MEGRLIVIPPAYLLRKTLWASNEDGTFVEMSEQMYRRRLRLMGVGNPDEILNEITEKHVVDIATPLAGWPAGFVINNGVRCLVTRGPKLVEPKEGSWHTIGALLTNMFRKVQLPYFKSWLQCMLERVMKQTSVPIQTIAIIGRPNSGKNRVQSWIITPLSGGTVANPYQYIVHSTGFNDDLGGATHLMIADENSYTSKVVRDRIGDYVRQLPVNEAQRIHPKGQKANQLVVMSVMSISCNLEPRDLLVIPPLEHNVQDRLHLFYAYSAPMPMATTTVGDKQNFEKQIREELPAFAYHLLNEWETPPDILDPTGRFPTATWHHTKLIERLNWISTEGQYRQIIFAVLKENAKAHRFVNSELQWNGSRWEGTAAELQRLLCDRDYGMRDQVMRLASTPRGAGELLSKLKDQYRTEFGITHKKNGNNVWAISLEGKLKPRFGKSRVL